MKKKILLLTAILLILTGSLFAQEYKLEASLERNSVSPGNPVYLHLTFFGSQDAPNPHISEINGLRIRYVGPATKVSIVNGKVSKSISHNYLIIPQKDGEYELGPFSIDHMGRTFISSPVTLRVGSVPAGINSPALSQKATGSVSATGGIIPAVQSPDARIIRPDMGYQSDNIFIDMYADKTTMYINEKVEVTIKLFVNNMEVKDIGYPVYSHEGFTSEGFEKPQRTVEYIKGVRYEALVFKQTLFGVKEGKFNLGPAKIECKIVSRNESSRRASFFGLDDFFSSRFGSKTYPVELISEEIPVHILPFPKEGRPEGFRGAVGDFSLEVYPQSNSVKVGDPVVVKSIIKGTGNLATVTAPTLSDIDGFKTYEPQVTIKGVSKIYEQIMIPTSGKAKELPEVSFSFFNPRIRKYMTLKKGPFPLLVKDNPGGADQIKMISADTGSAEVYIPKEKLGEDIIHIKERIGRLSYPEKYLFNKKYFWAAQIFTLFLFSVFYKVYRKKKRVIKDKGYARRLKAPRKARKGINKARSFLDKKDINGFYDILFRTFQEYLGNNFNLPKGNVSYQTIEKKISDSDVSAEIVSQLKHVFEKCDMIRYSSSELNEEPAEFLKTVREIIDYFEKKRI